MPEYVSPGVYVEEMEQGPRPIEGVPTSTAAFLGEAERGPLRPRLVTSYNEYKRWFGGVFADGRYMPHAVSGFFENGGRRLYVCRIAGGAATTASKVFGDFTVTRGGAGRLGPESLGQDQDGSTRDESGNTGFRLKFAYWSRVADDFPPYDPFEPVNNDRLPRPQQPGGLRRPVNRSQLAELLREALDRQQDGAAPVGARHDCAHRRDRLAAEPDSRDGRVPRPERHRRSGSARRGRLHR